MKVILVNGPPRSGKDEFGTALIVALQAEKRPAIRAKFADELKCMTHRLYIGRPEPPDAFESVKDTARPEFFGISPRRAYIAVSERLMKSVHGQDIFGRLLANNLRGFEKTAPNGFVVVTDSGFVEEAQVLISRFGEENVVLVRLYRPGVTFDGDSRSYIDLSDVQRVDINNDDTVPSLWKSAEILAELLVDGLALPSKIRGRA